MAKKPDKIEYRAPKMLACLSGAILLAIHPVWVIAAMWIALVGGFFRYACARA